MSAETPKQLKVFFSGSIRGGDRFKANYQQILDFLENFGEITSEHSNQIKTTEQHGSNSDADIYARDVRWIGESDILIAEVSQPSIGVGYEIAYAEAIHKPVLALYSLEAEKSISAMISGNPNIRTIKYETLGQLWPLLQYELSAMVV